MNFHPSHKGPPKIPVDVADLIYLSVEKHRADLEGQTVDSREVVDEFKYLFERAVSKRDKDSNKKVLQGGVAAGQIADRLATNIMDAARELIDSPASSPENAERNRLYGRLTGSSLYMVRWSESRDETEGFNPSSDTVPFMVFAVGRALELRAPSYDLDLNFVQKSLLKNRPARK